MKITKIMLSVALVCVAMASFAEDDKSNKDGNKTDNSAVVHKIKNLLLHSEYASSNNISGAYFITYKIENERISIVDIDGQNEKMKREIYRELNGKKFKGNDSSDLKKLKVIYWVN